MCSRIRAREPGDGLRMASIFFSGMLLFPLFAACQSLGDPDAAARAAFAAGQYPQAVKFYQEASAAHPHSAELHSALGLAYQMAGKHPQAIHSYLAALRLKNLPHTKELLAIERCRLHQYSAVAPLLVELAAHPAADDPLLPVLSPCYLQADDPLDALRVSKALALSPSISPDRALVYNTHASMAASHFFISRLSHASGGAAYMQYLKVARDSGSADARSGFPTAMEHSSYLRADLTLEQGLALFSEHSGDPALLYMLGVLTGEQAMQSTLDCQQKYPDSPWLAQFNAEMFAAQGQPDKAEVIYAELLTSHPELPDLGHDAAMLYRSQGKWEQALATFRAELAADPTDDRAVTGISESLIQLGDYQEAVDFLAPRFSIVQAPLWAAMDLSLAQQKLSKYSQAIAVLSRAEKIYPHEKQIHFRLMRLYTLNGQPSLARKESALFAAATHP